MYDIILKPEESPIGNPHKIEGLLALCGSVNQITVDQLEYAETNGFGRIHLINDQKKNLINKWTPWMNLGKKV